MSVPLGVSQWFPWRCPRKFFLCFCFLWLKIRKIWICIALRIVMLTRFIPVSRKLNPVCYPLCILLSCHYTHWTPPQSSWLSWKMIPCWIYRILLWLLGLLYNMFIWFLYISPVQLCPKFKTEIFDFCTRSPCRSSRHLLWPWILVQIYSQRTGVEYLSFRLLSHL